MKHKLKMVRIMNRLIPKLMKVVNRRLVSFLGRDIGKSRPKQKMVAQLVLPLEVFWSHAGKLFESPNTYRV